MTPLSALTLFVVMLGLAAVPSASVALVVARGAAFGVRNGTAVAAGIVLGDLVFVAFAIYGLHAIAEAMGSFFAVGRYAGGNQVKLEEVRTTDFTKHAGSQAPRITASRRHSHLPKCSPAKMRPTPQLERECLRLSKP